MRNRAEKTVIKLSQIFGSDPRRSLGCAPGLARVAGRRQTIAGPGIGNAIRQAGFQTTRQPATRSQASQFLDAAAQGDTESAAQFLAVTYQELRRLAAVATDDEVTVYDLSNDSFSEPLYTVPVSGEPDFSSDGKRLLLTFDQDTRIYEA